YANQQIAYNLFRMGFCTYDVGAEKKAGMIVFDPNGNAKVFHSAASRANFEAYAYEAYNSEMVVANSGMKNATLLIDAKWSIRLTPK
ncbi:MAG: hypothetical protein V4736_02975, partial [Bdellovibrionota bacterium]